MSRSESKTLRERQKEARDARIYEAALALFRAGGFQATTMQQVADAAGVSRGTVFNYYPYKEAILVRYFALELAALRQDLPSAAEPLRGLYEVFDRLADFVEANRSLVLPLSYELLNPDPERSRAAYAQLPLAEVIRHYLAAARDRGEVRSDHSLGRLARSVANTWFLTALQWAAYRPDRSIRSEQRTALKLALEGIAPHADAKRTAPLEHQAAD